MERLLRFNAYAMFLLLFILPMFLPFLLRRASFLPDEVVWLALSLIKILNTLLYSAWIYAACAKLSTLLPADIPLSPNRVKVLLLLPGLSMMSGTLFVLLGVDITGEWYIWFNAGATILALIGLLYSIGYMARLLKTVEYERPISTSDFAGDFFRILFFPFGIWNIQPRLNDVAAMRPEEMDIFKQDPIH